MSIDAATGDGEVGIGTYTASGTTLSRDVILESSNSGSAVNFVMVLLVPLIVLFVSVSVPSVVTERSAG